MKDISQFIFEFQRAPGTKRGYEQHLTYFSKWWNGDPLEEITPQRFLEYLETKPKWSDSMRHNSVCAMKAYLKWAIGEFEAPGIKRRIMRFNVQRDEPPAQRSLTREEINTLASSLNLTKPAHQRNLVMLYLSVDSALRSSELCNLKIGDLDLDNQQLYARRKGGKTKPGGYTAYTRTWLEALLVERRGYAKIGVEEVFLNVEGIAKGEKVKPDHWRVICRRWAIRAGIRHFSPHALKRTFAELASQRGAPTHMIMQAGGWDDPAMVRRYTRGLKIQAFEKYLPTHSLKKIEGPVAAGPSGGVHQ